MIWRPSHRTARSSDERGFTLLEMIIVLVVLGLVLGIAVSRGPSRSRSLDVRATVSQVVLTLRQARGAAIAANRPVTVVVNGAQRSLSVDGARPLQLPPGFGLTAASGLDAVPGPKLAGIRFAPNGSSTGGRIVLADGKRRVLVGVDWLTGRVSVADAP
jgi:general secretion pathway protein H